MSALLLLLVCSSACALPSNTNIQDVEEINRLDVMGSANKPSTAATLSTNRRVSSVGIVGGNETTIDVYPFAVMIIVTTYASFVNCGGTILNTRSVLTAAHCEAEPKYLLLRMGSSKADDGTEHEVKSFTTHPKYYENGMDSDIAIVRSATIIVYVPHAVQPGVTAPADYNLADGEKVWVIGWGDTKEKGNEPDQLRHVQIFTINQSVCKERYGTSYENNKIYNITENMLCAGILDVGGKDSCQGDSGGPIIHNGVVVGIVSWGIGCGRPHYPGVNTRVSRFAEWIEKNK